MIEDASRVTTYDYTLRISSPLNRGERVDLYMRRKNYALHASYICVSDLTS